MTMYELTQSIQSHALNKYILLEHFVTFLLAISPLAWQQVISLLKNKNVRHEQNS